MPDFQTVLMKRNTPYPQAILAGGLNRQGDNE